MKHPLPAINNVIPEKSKPWIVILFVIVFQFSGGVYLAATNEMAGSTALIREDILMAGYASLIGMALTFVIMLRLKMRFTSKFVFLLCSAALIISNIICLHTCNVVVLVTTCFFSGFFRMWATFECNSTIQLWLSPKRDLSVFFSYVYLLVQASILLSGVTDTFTAYFLSWEYFHWLISGALLFIMLVTLLIFNNKRVMPLFPLLGIDWLGAIMWALTLLCVNFIAVYGEHYNWWDSMAVQTATLFLIVLLMLNIYRASFIRHPFISLRAFRYKAVYLTFFLYIVVDIFLSPAHLIEHLYLENILQLDSLNMTFFNGVGVAGVLTGAFFSWYYFAVKKRSYKSTFLIGFSAILVYLLMMYFLLDYQTTREMLIVPVFLRNFGYLCIAVVLLTNLTKVPFHHFFHAVSIQAFVSAACGSAIGEAVLHRLFNTIAAKNFQLLSANLDHVSSYMTRISPSQLMVMLQRQVILVSFKEVYGALVIFSLLFFVLFLLYNYPYLPLKALYPKNRTIRKILKKEIEEG